MVNKKVRPSHQAQLKRTKRSELTFLLIFLVIASTLQIVPRSRSQPKRVLLTKKSTTLHPKSPKKPSKTNTKSTKAEKLLNNILKEIHVKQPSPEGQKTDPHSELDPKGYHPLKAYAFTKKQDFDQLKKEKPENWRILVEEQIPSLTELLQRIFKVIEKQEILVSATQKCFEDLPPVKLAGHKVEADLVIEFRLVNKAEKGIDGGPCLWHKKTGRPLWVVVFIDQANLTTKVRLWEKQFATLVQGVFHGMGLYEDYYKDFRDPNTADYTKIPSEKSVFKDKEGHFHITTPKLLQVARDHFDCQSLKSIPMEGISYGHWDRSFVAGSALGGGDQITPITLAYLEDSGWYKVDYKEADVWTYGYRSGCGFILQDCEGHEKDKGNNYFSCQEKDYSRLGCSIDYKKKAKCSNLMNQGKLMYIGDSSSLDCRFPENSKTDENQFWAQRGEFFGQGSRCFNGIMPPETTKTRTTIENKAYRVKTKMRAGCFNAFCRTTRKGQKTIVIDAYDKDFQCTESFGKLHTSHEDGEYIECPHIPSFCLMEDNECPEDCNFQGRCVEGGKCRCYHGWSGKACHKKALGQATISSSVKITPVAPAT